MLTLYEGGFTSQAHGEIIKSIKRNIDAGKRVFLFVPEQQTLSAEAEACDVFPPSAARSFEVTNFTRFTNTAFRTLGGIGKEYITSAKKALVMWGVLTELSPMLTLTKGAKNISAGIVSKALQAVNELSLLGISKEDLSSSEKLLQNEDKRLKSKLADITLIYSLYKTKLKERYSDSAEDVMSLAQKLDSDSSYLDGAAIFFEGFTSFTEPQYALVRSLIKGADVSVSLTLRKATKGGFEYTEIRETERRLIRLARESDEQIKILTPDAIAEDFNPTLTEIVDLLWRNEGVIDNESLQNLGDNYESLRIFEAATPFDECDFVAADIKRRVIAGDSYKDFAIVARSLDSYAGILDTSLLKVGVAHFMSSPKSINSFEAIKLINTAYSVITGRFATSEVLTYAKCGLIGISKEESDLFELYVNKWSIGGARFTDGEVWNMNPRGYETLNDADIEALTRINDIRRRIIEPLLLFSEDANAAKTVREHAEALLDFLLKMELEEKLRQRATELSELGEEDAAKQNLRLWQIICDSLDTLVDTLADLPADAESFINQLCVIFNDTNIGSIPSYLDEVTVGSADMLRLHDKKHVYLIGVNSEEFPKTVSDNSYFTERDKATLGKLGLAVRPELEIKNARELYAFSRSFSFAKRSVTLLYTEKTASLGSAMPSEVISKISEITSGKIKPINVSELPLLQKIYSPQGALENLGKATETEKAAIKSALENTDYARILKVSEGKLENDEVQIDEDTMGVIIGKDVYLSQSKIDKYLKCPFKYFSRFMLGIEESEKAQINQLVVGNFIHSVLENVFRSVMNEHRSLSDLSESERDSLTEACAKGYVKRELGDVTSAKNNVIIDRIKRVAKPIVDGLCDEFANCRFTPVHCELHIDSYDPKTPNSIIYNTGDNKRRVIIGGYIDRLDTCKIGDDVYVRVIDYKTGIKSFSLDDVKKGENLQMLLYLKSVVETTNAPFLKELGVGENGRLIPAGIVYVKTSVKDVQIDRPSDELAIQEVKSSFERLGASLDDPASLSAMNPNYTPMQKSSKKDAPPTPLTYTQEDWERINEQMQSAVLSIADEICSGRVKAKTNVSDNATYHPCDGCQYKFICRNAVK